MSPIHNIARLQDVLDGAGDTDRFLFRGCASGELSAAGSARKTKEKGRENHFAGLLSCAVLLLFALQIAGCGEKDKEKAQTTPAAPASQPAQPSSATPPAPKPDAKPLTTLESLVAPVALYPDPLLAEVLVAATYPLEIVQAARWLESKPDPATVRTQNWDASVMRLTAVPDVITMMNQHLDWTTQLGDAFLSTPSDVMDTIQSLRKRAADAGYLKDSEAQKVETETVSAPEPEQVPPQTEGVKATPAVLTKEVITIQPAKADTLSVPSYNPEVVYSAPLAPPPATAQAYPAAVAAQPAYYPAYYPQPVATTTTTSSSSDEWMTFGAGAVVGGLLTWGIMEWADDDDWDDYHVSHYYGNAVCSGGNCWHGGGGGRYGNVNSNRNVNISGNEINIDRDGTFRQDQLPALKDRSDRWQPDPRHRRGQAYPVKARERLGSNEMPALAGNRLSNAQTLPADRRGFGPADRPAGGRLSTGDIQKRLAETPGKDNRLGKTDKLSRSGQIGRDNALDGLRESGRNAGFESRRGASSLDARQQLKSKPRTKDVGGGARRSEIAPSAGQRRSQPAAQRPPSQQQMARQRNEQAERIQSQRRQEAARPNAFDSARDGSRSRDFGNRGSASFGRAQPARQTQSFGGQRTGSRSGGGGGGGRGGARGRGGSRR